MWAWPRRPAPSPPSGARTIKTVRKWVGAGVGAVGLVTVVTGMFLSWSRSGMTYRNSFSSLGVLRELGFVGTLVTVWVGMIPVVAIAIALFSIGLRRSAAILAAILSIIMGTISGVAAVQQGDEGSLIGIASSGPAVTLAGSALGL